MRGYKGIVDKKQYSGLGGNLKYFKTAFVDAEPTDKNIREMVSKSTEMLCLKEECFEEIKKGKYFKIFKNAEDKHLGIAYDDEGITPLKKVIKKLNKKFVVYVFSLDESAREEEFEDILRIICGLINDQEISLIWPNSINIQEAGPQIIGAYEYKQTDLIQESSSIFHQLILRLIEEFGFKETQHERMQTDSKLCRERVNVELDIAERTLTIGTDEKFISSESTWNFLKTLVDNKKQKRITPRRDGQIDWKNAVDTLRRIIKKDSISLRDIITSSRDGYRLAQGVTIKGGGQIGIRSTKLSPPKRSRRNGSSDA